jgi:pSer/pThr/pTyr-binding forkhead associated (FHA) protein
MAKLILTVDGEVAGTYFIDVPRFTIGSLEDSSLPLALPGVSRAHAAISTVGNDDILEDLNSTNGTLVNGSRVTRHILQHDDVIEIGNCQIRYRSQKAVSGPSLDRTMVIKGLAPAAAEGGIPQSAGLERAAARKTAQARSAYRLGLIRVMKGPQAGKEIELPRVLRTFGKPGVQLAVINRRPHGYFITHVEGRKPALLNGKSIGSEPQPLAPNDIISVGDEELRFLLR